MLFDAIDYLVQEIVFHEAAWQAYFTRYEITPFTVIYEDLVPHYEKTALNILDWLNIPNPEDIVFGERRLLKQTNSVSERWVERYCGEKRIKRWKWRGVHLFLCRHGSLIRLMFRSEVVCAGHKINSMNVI